MAKSSKHKGGLGRGIGALIPTAPVSRETSITDRPADLFFGAPEAQLQQIEGLALAAIPQGEIRPNAQQPRHDFDPDDMAELVHSIGEFGVLQPIVVRPVDEPDFKYELIMGERRWRASQEAGLREIPAIIKNTPDDEMLRDALLENLHRSELNPLEEASAYQQLLDDFKITQEELASRIGRSRPQISNTMRLLKLPEELQKQVAAGVLRAGHARALLAVADKEQMLNLGRKIVNQDLSVREAEALATNTKRSKPRRAAVKAGAYRDHLDEIAERLEDKLETPVSISLTKTKGKLTIDFATIGDLNRILDQLGIEHY